ncbi:VOC family protein [Nocardia cyriacigeorgica]|jgi:glyoxylase I family protein|uniref:VOC family protein n=1 Tax=Nocardia cyriacigeorgica TaxID=135487 RepID=UPI00031DE84E|nr:VOC family protein [Nocardia cyriacigeorgica]AVH22819.1 glyoxalase [Nocardia cyriacigeorgica]MBF6325725.1 VOC family protein [Nocardia cyriacigeorgica]MBF6498498.1 VOC family protein [Nocardia cyriacigeorgica]PPJ16524.1 glyoxalase [Nocardia cyriacigeorgica]TLF56633.1 VOC family protein [Nocardia cyriacigeorgica]
MSLATSLVHHIRLTVTDLERSREFYEDVLGFEVAAESPGNPADPLVRADPFQLYGGVVFQTPGGMLLGLRPVADPTDHFDSERVGLDHLSFTVDSREDLVKAIARFDEAGVEHGDIVEMDQFGIAILGFNDPDGIHLELTTAI